MAWEGIDVVAVRFSLRFPLALNPRQNGSQFAFTSANTGLKSLHIEFHRQQLVYSKVLRRRSQQIFFKSCFKPSGIGQCRGSVLFAEATTEVFLRASKMEAPDAAEVQLARSRFGCYCLFHPKAPMIQNQQKPGCGFFLQKLCFRMDCIGIP